MPFLVIHWLLMFILEIRYQKLKRVSGERNKPKKNTMKEKKKLELAPLDFEPAPQLPPAQKVRPHITGPCDHSIIVSFKINSLEVFFSVIHTL